MELGLSLGDAPNLPFSFLDSTSNKKKNLINNNHEDLGFYFGLSLNTQANTKLASSLNDPSLQLDLFPPLSVQHKSSPQLRLLPWWTTHNSDSSARPKSPGNQLATTQAENEELESEGVVSLSSPKSIVSNFQMELSNNHKSRNNKREYNKVATISDDDDDEGEENGSTRKKLRLSKDQSANLEDSFKDHHTLNPKQKLALAKQLNLRTRQVEVWFQNRRARTKLKQTEVNCEHLKRCCDTLTEENKKLTKELLELRALKSSQPYFMQLPPTTLTMCPSCERVSSSSKTSTTIASTVTAAIAATTANSNTFVAKSVLHPFTKHARHTAS